MGKIEEAIEDVIQDHLSGLDFSEVITSEVRDCWDMDQLDRVDETVDRVDAIEAWINNAEDNFSTYNNAVELKKNVTDLKNSVKNLVEHTNILQLRIRDLEDRLKDYEKIREMAWQSAHKKSFIQKLMFWR